MQVSQECGHLLVSEPAGEGRHEPLSGEDNVLDRGIGGWSAAGQCRSGKDPMKIWRDLLEAKVVFLVAMGATNLVQVLPCCLLLCQFELPMATRDGDCKQEGEQDRSDMGGRVHFLEGLGFAGTAQNATR